MKKVHLPEEPSSPRTPTFFVICIIAFLAITLIHCIRVLAGERVLPAP
jgi:hypothetical protein